MERVSGLISKKVISIDEGCKLGYVLNLAFDSLLKSFDGLIVVDDESENQFFLNTKDILSVGDDCVVVEGKEKLTLDVFSFSNNPIGKEVYDAKGTFFGKVQDVFVDGRKVKKLLTNRCEIPQRYIQKTGDDFVIFGLVKSKESKNKFFQKKIEQNYPKAIATDLQNITNEVKRENQIRLFVNSNLLIGKILTNDLFGKNNEIIARKNDKIDKNIIKNAKIHNKLNILSYYSK